MLNIFNKTLLTRTKKKVFPSIQSRKHASYFTITLTLFSLSFFGLFAIRPTIITAVTLIKSVSELRKLNMDYENKISNIIRAQSEYEQIRDSLPLVETAIPDNSYFNQLARAIENFSKKTNLSIQQILIDNVPISYMKSSSSLNSYGFSLIISGKYDDIFSFLSHIINWRRIVNINSVELSHEIATSGGLLRLSLKGTTFYEP